MYRAVQITDHREGAEAKDLEKYPAVQDGSASKNYGWS